MIVSGNKMSTPCVQCITRDRTNKHRLEPLLLSVIYESADIISSLDLPRKYTSIRNNNTSFISIGHNYNKKLLSSEEITRNQSYVIGQWIKSNDKFEIHLEVLVSSDKNRDAETRNKRFCQELDIILEGIAFAETGLLKSNPTLAGTKIFVRFKSIDAKYDRIEYWHRLGFWTQNSHSSKHEEKVNSERYERTEENNNSDNGDKKKKDRKRSHQQHPPQRCQMCANK